MANPLLANFNGGQFLNDIDVPDNIKQAFNAIRGAQNPQGAIQLLAQKNPQIAQVLQMCNGKSLEQFFYDKCREKNVNPISILNQLMNN